MSLFMCCLWWFVLGVLVGWLLSWLLNRFFGRTQVQEVSAPAPAPVVATPRVEDLTKIEGVGPKIAELLRGNGIDSFARLSRTDVARLWSILEKGGTRFRLANPGTRPAQAEYAVRGDWAGLKRYQDELYVGIQLYGDVQAEVDVAAAKAAGFDL
jgi:Helix-hairpin-helix domain